MWKLILLLAPAALAVRAIVTGSVVNKVAATLTSFLLVLLTVPRILEAAAGAPALAVAAALAVSAVGDYLLATKGDRAPRFVGGIAAFFAAHVGYLAFALTQGRPSWIALVAVLVPCLAYYLLVLRSRVRPLSLSLATLVYLVASCLTFSAAVGMDLPPASKWLYVAAIALLMGSDTVISFVEFLGWKKTEPFILPTYYLFQICLVASLLLWGLGPAAV